MMFDMLRSNADASSPVQRGPLIFAAMAATPQPSVVGRSANRHIHPQNPYPSPPTEYASLEMSPSARYASVPRGPTQPDPRWHQGLGISPALQPTELPPLARTSSKNSLVRVAIERTPSASTKGDTGSDHSRPRVLTKARPTTPQKPNTSPSQKMPSLPGDPLLLDEDPFARVEGVRMLQPRTGSSSGTDTPSSYSASLGPSKEDGVSSEEGQAKAPGTPPPTAPTAPLTPSSVNEVSAPTDTPPPCAPGQAPPTPTTPDHYKTARQQRRGLWLEKVPPAAVAEVVAKLEQDSEPIEEPPREPTPPPPTYFPIMAFLSDAHLFPLLLSYLSYSEWLPLYSANKQVRALFQSRLLREFVLERYLGTVGYSKWNYEWAEPLALSLKASCLSPYVHISILRQSRRISITIYGVWRCQHTSMAGFLLRTCTVKRPTLRMDQTFLPWP